MTDRVLTSGPGAAPQDHGFAAQLRGFGPLGLIAILIVLAGNVVMPPLSAIFVLVWVGLSRTPWREIGYVRPRSWLGGALVGILFGACFKLAMKAVVMPLLGAPETNPAYHFLVGNDAALPRMILTMLVVAGFGEETLFRGYLFERLGKLLGRGVVARTAIVVGTALLFGALHYADQGVPGVEQAVVTGLVFGTVFAVTGRIWTLMWAHAAFDLTAVAMIYLGAETRVAHLVFG
jgi:membrane protease YdiL (CAAX protease family)